MSNLPESNKLNRRYMVGNISLLVCVIYMAVAYWNEYSWYTALTPYGTLIAAVSLTITFFAYTDIKNAIKDPVLYLVAFTDVMALINIILVKSNYGALLTVFDVSLALYLAGKLVIPDKMLAGISTFLAFFFFYWTFDVKGYFKGYNTNYGGMVLMIGFIFFFVAFYYFKEYLKKKGYVKITKYLIIWEIFMFAWGYNIISWYRARCALMGLIVFAILLVLPGKFIQKKWFYILMVAGVSIGAVLISVLYVWLGEMKDVFTVQIFYKDILSGREAVWRELWLAFLQKPMTGIGSAYQIQLDWMEGVFEVHNGLLDILIVHGITVFVPLASLFTARVYRLRNMAPTRLWQIKCAGVMSVLVISFMENCFIVPPFLLCLIILMSSQVCEEKA